MTVHEEGISRRNLVIVGALGALAAAMPAMAQETKIDPALKQANPETVEALKALFDSYMKAFSAQDMAGVIASFTPQAVILGTGPGEIWGGPEEIGAAHKNFFQLFDAGKQEHEALFRSANILGDMAWLLSMSRVKFTKGKDVTEFGLNSSVVFEKVNGKWLIRTMHFSNLTIGANAPKA